MNPPPRFRARRKGRIFPLAAAALAWLPGPADAANPLHVFRAEILWNRTGQDANDLHIELGAGNIIGATSSGSFSQIEYGSLGTKLDFSNGTHPNDDPIIIEWTSYAVAPYISEYYWTLDGARLFQNESYPPGYLSVSPTGNGSQYDVWAVNMGASPLAYTLAVSTNCSMVNYSMGKFLNGASSGNDVPLLVPKTGSLDPGSPLQVLDDWTPGTGGYTLYSLTYDDGGGERLVAVGMVPEAGTLVLVLAAGIALLLRRGRSRAGG